MIERNKRAAGRLSNMLFGVANILDGIVRIGSLGFLRTRFPITVAKNQALNSFKKMKQSPNVLAIMGICVISGGMIAIMITTLIGNYRGQW